jgi:alpha-D-xyloside xylohydrolase
MKKRILLISLISLLASGLYAQKYKQIDNGAKATVQFMGLEVRFLSPDIVRITKTPQGVINNKKSLSVVKTPEKVELTYQQNGNILNMKSNALSVDMNLVTGRVTFAERQTNKKLFTEKDYGAQFTLLDQDNLVFIARQAFLLDDDEPIYGLGQNQNGKLMQRDIRYNLKNENTKVCIPFFYSLKGYGVFWDNYSPTTYTDNVQETSFESLGGCCDYYFMYGGDITGVQAKMRDLTGQAPMFPLWTYGYWQSRERYKTQDELLGVVEKYRSLKVPLDGIIQDWQYWGKDSLWNSMSWNETNYPDPVKMADKVHKMNAHLMVVAWPGFGPQTKQYEELKGKSMMLNFDTWPPNSGTKPYDPYNEKARDIYWDYLNKGVFSIGTDAWWLDSSEPDHINIKDADFEQRTALGKYNYVINAFPLMHTTGVYQNQRKVTSDKRVFILTRSAFAGQQRNAANTWSGDVGSSWENLALQIPAACNLSICGIPYWNADIGGFFAGGYNRDGGARNPMFQELYVRWAQFASLTPMMRSHGTDIPREIYQFGDRGTWAFDAVEKAIKLRYRLLPYVYSTAWKVTNQAGLFMYALPLMYPKDVKTHDMNTEYMFGESLLVLPVLQPLYTSKKDGKISEDFSKLSRWSVYLPEGNKWIDFWTGETKFGGEAFMRETSIDEIPVYVKPGAILPWGPEVQYATEKKWDNLEIRVYPGADGEFTLYEDENDNYNYEKGVYSTITFKWDDKNSTLSIGARKGEFPGMLKSRKFNIVVVGTDNGFGLTSKKAGKAVSYKGLEVAVKM